MSRQKFDIGCYPRSQGVAHGESARPYREARDLHVNVASAPGPAPEPPILVMDRVMESSIDVLLKEIDYLHVRLAPALREPYPKEDCSEACAHLGESSLAQALLVHSNRIKHATDQLRRLLDRLEL